MVFIYFQVFLITIFLVGCTQHEGLIIKTPGAKCHDYATCIKPIKQELTNGDYEQVEELLQTLDDVLSKKYKDEPNIPAHIGMLNLLEMTTLYLYIKDINKSLTYSRYAECLIEQRDNESYLTEYIRRTVGLISGLVGNNKSTVYYPPGYEKVLLLNIQAMNYLLEGDDRAFNVAKKATEWQKLEKEKFQKVLETITKESKKWDATDKGETDDEKVKIQREVKNEVFRTLAKEYAKYDKQALRVPSAFVNPFGDYLAGIVKEYKSVEKGYRSLMDNAKIHYKSAYKLNPKSRVLKFAYRDAKRKRSAKRLIQIIAFDGFVPEKRIFKFDIKIKKLKEPIHFEVPIYVPIESKVKTIVVSTTRGKVLAHFRPVADVEALALRHQKDLLPVVQFLALVAAARDTALQLGSNSLKDFFITNFGYRLGLSKFINDVVDDWSKTLEKSLEPDTSTWMTLPKHILAARFHPSKGLKNIVITSYDTKGRVLSRQKIKLGKGGRHFMFVRTIDDTMQVIPGKFIWSPKERIERIECH